MNSPTKDVEKLIAAYIAEHKCTRIQAIFALMRLLAEYSHLLARKSITEEKKKR